MRGVRTAKGDRRERPTLNIDEILRLADAIGDRYRALVLVGAILGLRWSEAIGLRVSDVDFLRRTLTVRQTISEVEGRLNVARTKSRAERCRCHSSWSTSWRNTLRVSAARGTTRSSSGRSVARFAGRSQPAGSRPLS